MPRRFSCHRTEMNGLRKRRRYGGECAVFMLRVLALAAVLSQCFSVLVPLLELDVCCLVVRLCRISSLPQRRQARRLSGSYSPLMPCCTDFTILSLVGSRWAICVQRSELFGLVVHGLLRDLHRAVFLHGGLAGPSTGLLALPLLLSGLGSPDERRTGAAPYGAVLQLRAERDPKSLRHRRCCRGAGLNRVSVSPREVAECVRGLTGALLSRGDGSSE